MHRKPHPYLHGEMIIVVDCADLDRSAAFWTGVLGYVRGEPGGEPYQDLLPADGNGIEVMLQQVPEGKQGKNRLHLDFRTRDLESEVARIVGLGATVMTEEPVSEHGWRWHILADPDGNEFCVLQAPASYWPS
jgi:predicted enzyme related to lactoylglutathione lyase